ncbi:hypothetical protein K9M48_04640 [Candidatus Gracilibacteria bacterium]|nr:hypothetical protein [Candidatus Gracilibacteria bacterium]
MNDALISGFVTVPVDQAILGDFISTTRCFPRKILQEKLKGKNLNGNFRVIQIMVEPTECKKTEEVVTIPLGSSGQIVNCYEIKEFIDQN